MKKIKYFFKNHTSKRPDYRIVYVENDNSYGEYGPYYKIEVKKLFGYQDYYFRVPNSISFDQNEFRFKNFDDAKEELDLLVQGKSKYNCFEKVVYEASKKEQVIEQSA